MIPEIKNLLYATDLSKNSSYAFFMLSIWGQTPSCEGLDLASQVWCRAGARV